MRSISSRCRSGSGIPALSNIFNEIHLLVGERSMAYTATVVPVIIASPGDVDEQRDDARQIINNWNYINSLALNTVLMPVGWETHSAPDLGGRAQELINERVLADCDLLVGIFWTRLGTPTGGFKSGTAEEIQRHLDAGRPAMVYFSTAPVAPQSIDPIQFAALTDFRNWCQTKGIIETFENSPDFRTKFTSQLQIQIHKSPYLVDLLKSPAPPGIGPTAGTPNQSAALSDEAKQLLLEASLDGGGHLLKLATLGGRYIQTNGKTFGDPGNARSAAVWEFAFDQLVSQDLIVERGQKGEVFSVTKLGYDIAEQLKNTLGR